MIKTEFLGVVVDKDQKKFLYRKIDVSLLLAFISGGLLGIGIAFLSLFDRVFWGVPLVILSFILFFVARYFGLKILFTDDDFKEKEDGE